MNYPSTIATLADLERARWWKVMFILLHRSMYNFMWSGFLLKLWLGTWIESKFGIMAYLAMWVRKVDMLPVKKQFFGTTPAFL